MQKVNIGIIGTGWCGGIRAETCAASPYVSELHIAEIKEARLKEVAEKTKPVTATTDYRALLKNDNINAIIVSATPETVHYPMAKETLLAGKHLLLEKPISLTLAEADELIDLARSKSLLFTIGYSQRFNPKFAYVKRSIADGTIGQPVSALVSRHITRNLGNKIGGRIKLSPAAMEATHDIDFVLWCFEPRKPVRVYAQLVNKIMQPTHGVPGLRLDHRDAGRRQRFHDRRRLGASACVSEFFLHVDRDGRQRRRDHGGRLAPRRQHQHDEARHRIPALHHARRKSGPRLCGPHGGGDHPLSGLRRARQAAARHSRARSHGHAGLSGRGPIGRGKSAHRHRLANCGTQQQGKGNCWRSSECACPSAGLISTHLINLNAARNPASRLR